MPADGTGIPVGNSAALTVIPFSGNEIFFYHGDLKYALQTGLYGFTNYALSDGLGDIIRAKQKAMDQIKPGMRKDLMLIIKPTQGSSYENVINTLDEVMINDVPHYAIVDMSNAEISVMSDKRK